MFNGQNPQVAITLILFHSNTTISTLWSFSIPYRAPLMSYHHIDISFGLSSTKKHVSQQISTSIPLFPLLFCKIVEAITTTPLFFMHLVSHCNVNVNVTLDFISQSILASNTLPTAPIVFATNELLSCLHHITLSTGYKHNKQSPKKGHIHTPSISYCD